MFERLFENTVIPLLSRVAAFTQARHRTILSNIANADSPGYRAQDLAETEFQKQLTQAVERRDRHPEEGFRLRPSRHSRALADGRVVFKPAPRAAAAGPDGNTVNVETEMVALIKNTMRHNTALELMRKQFSLIEAAIRERI